MSARTTGRLLIPKKPADFLKLAKTIYEKHLAAGAASPLNAAKAFDWSVEGPKIAICTTDHENAEAFKKKAEDAYLSRDINLKQLRKVVKNGASLLKNINADNPKKLGDWGIVVDDTVKVKKLKKP